MQIYKDFVTNIKEINLRLRNYWNNYILIYFNVQLILKSYVSMHDV